MKAYTCIRSMYSHQNKKKILFFKHYDIFSELSLHRNYVTVSIIFYSFMFNKLKWMECFFRCVYIIKIRIIETTSGFPVINKRLVINPICWWTPKHNDSRRFVFPMIPRKPEQGLRNHHSKISIRNLSIWIWRSRRRRQCMTYIQTMFDVT